MNDVIKNGTRVRITDPSAYNGLCAAGAMGTIVAHFHDGKCYGVVLDGVENPMFRPHEGWAFFDSEIEIAETEQQA